MKAAAILIGSLLLAPAAQAKAPLPWPSGTYSNVTTHAETGDMLGMEARFFVVEGRHMVEFVWCEGWCNDVYVLPVTREAGGFTFHYAQRADVGAASEYRFVASPVGPRLKIAAWQGRQPVDESRPQQLWRLAKPFAIPFAKANGAH